MKTFRYALILALALATVAFADQTVAQKQFDTMKTLVGSWEGKTNDGRSVQVKFRVTANGSALVSEIGGKEDMLTMVNLDRDRLLLTHYCSAGNQPRMKASASPDGKTITFDFVDATNLASPADDHMQRVTFFFTDPNHHAEEWVFSKDGKEFRERFELERKSTV